VPVLVCLICGAAATSADVACPECGGFDAASIDAPPPPSDRDERLLARIADALRAKSELGEADPRTSSVRARLDGQAALLRARLASRAMPAGDRDRAFLEYALARVERALDDLPR
jgi:hypothetical protein